MAGRDQGSNAGIEAELEAHRLRAARHLTPFVEESGLPVGGAPIQHWTSTRRILALSDGDLRSVAIVAFDRAAEIGRASCRERV